MSTEPKVDSYGNDINGDSIEFCCFPDCGCDGARLCQAENGPSDYCQEGNVEGMWSGNSPEQLVARKSLVFIESCQGSPDAK